jgi:hypothetical protein
MILSLAVPMARLEPLIFRYLDCATITQSSVVTILFRYILSLGADKHFFAILSLAVPVAVFEL